MRPIIWVSIPITICPMMTVLTIVTATMMMTKTTATTAIVILAGFWFRPNSIPPTMISKNGRKNSNFLLNTKINTRLHLCHVVILLWDLGFHVSEWNSDISTQRTAYKEKTISKNRVQRLGSIGFEWKIRESLPAPWIEMYKQLKEYNLQYGSTCVPKRYRADPKLAQWVAYQRRRYHKGELALLESVGFQWKLLEMTPWIEMYGQLKEYKLQYGSTCVPKRYKPDIYSTAYLER